MLQEIVQETTHACAPYVGEAEIGKNERDRCSNEHARESCTRDATAAVKSETSERYIDCVHPSCRRAAEIKN